MRTYSRADFLEAKRQWASFGPRWERIRRIGAERGFLFPPSGTEHDDRDADAPSQRAIIWRALEDNPAELERIVSRSRSWSDVVDRIFGLESRLREDAGLNAKAHLLDRLEQPTHRDAASSLAAIFERIEASR